MNDGTSIAAVSNEYSVILAARMAKRVRSDGDCWVWIGEINPKGYGRMSLRRPNGKFTSTGAHRVSWLVYRGWLPDELQIDHLCFRRSCINPEHLDVVTFEVNIERRLGINRPKFDDRRGGPAPGWSPPRDWKEQPRSHAS
jgi:hypothetical protein